VPRVNRPPRRSPPVGFNCPAGFALAVHRRARTTFGEMPNDRELRWFKSFKMRPANLLAPAIGEKNRYPGPVLCPAAGVAVFGRLY
jgi:hypothetical protein